MMKLDADLFCRLRLHADIDGGVRAFTGLHDGKLGLKSGVLRLKGGDPCGDTVANRPGTCYKNQERNKRTENHFATTAPSMSFAVDMVR
jgi:hypothetical protein